MAEHDGLDGIREELAQEGAISLGLCGKRLVAALEELAAYDAGAARDSAVRRGLVDAAAERAWYYLIQREVMGWHDNQAALASFGVPPEVRVRMGAVRVGGAGDPSG